MAKKRKIDPEINRARVRASMERRGTERLGIYLKPGTLERIAALGLKGSTFARGLIMAELDRLEKMEEGVAKAEALKQAGISANVPEKKVLK